MSMDPQDKEALWVVGFILLFAIIAVGLSAYFITHGSAAKRADFQLCIDNGIPAEDCLERFYGK